MLKSTANGVEARKYYTELTTPISSWEGQIRDLVLKKKQVGKCANYIRRSLLTILKASKHIRTGELIFRSLIITEILIF